MPHQEADMSVADQSQPEYVEVPFTEGEGAGELETKLNTSQDPRAAIAEWTGTDVLRLYPPSTSTTERQIIFIPRPSKGPQQKYNNIAIIRDLDRPNDPPILRRKLKVESPDTPVGAPLMRRELYNPIEDLPVVIAESGGDPETDYPTSPEVIRERLARFAVDEETGYVLNITGDHCYRKGAKPVSVGALNQCEIEFMGVLPGVEPPSLPDIQAGVERATGNLYEYLLASGLNPEPTDMSKNRYIEGLAREDGIIV